MYTLLVYNEFTLVSYVDGWNLRNALVSWKT